jgi:hypothetical protein
MVTKEDLLRVKKEKVIRVEDQKALQAAPFTGGKMSDLEDLASIKVIR